MYKDEEEAVIAALFHHLCDFPPQWIKGLDSETYSNIRRDLESFITNTDLPLQRFITIDGVEYGFEPNLSKMSYGAYVDISQWDSITLDKNWAKIMSILYRRVTKKVGSLYEVEPYKGEIDENLFLGVGMDVHWGALFFFKTLLEDLRKSTQNSLMEFLPKLRNIHTILEKNGNLIPR